MPVKMTATAVMDTMPPWLSAMAEAMGVVTDLGSSEAVRAASRPNARHSAHTESTEVTAPTVQPTSTGSRFRFRTSRLA